ncbi:MAG: hypothetical protein R6U98_08270 [Pirellulaceae bacterium]
MINDVLRLLRWSVSLGAKFARVVPLQTSLIVLVTLVSQISALLAAFLPLKVVILLGSENIPRYIPEALAILGRDTLIVTLSVATVGFFVSHLLAERLIALITGLASQRLLEKSHKMVLFENQEETAARAYQRFSRTLAGGVFVVFALLGLTLAYPNISFIVIAYAGSVTFIFLTLGTYSPSFSERLETELPATMNVTAGIGFFVAFAYLIIDFIGPSPPGIIVAIISLLLSRQIFNRLAGIVQDLSALHTQRARYEALFFHGKILLRQEPNEERTIWPLLERKTRDDWVSAVMMEQVREWQGPALTAWHSSGVPNVAALKVYDTAGQKKYLVKIFESNRRSLALHEWMLLSASPKGLSAPVFLASTEVRRFPCLIYALPSGSPVTKPREVRRLTQSLKAHFLEIEPPAALVKRYRRSHPMLWRRIDALMLQRLRVAVETSDQDSSVTHILQRLPALQGHLAAIPLGILNPDMTQATIWVKEMEQQPLLFNWTRWSLDPAGAGWGDREEQLEKLVAALEQGVPRRACLSQVRPEQAKLSALTYALEAKLLKQQFPEALDLVARILELLDLLDGKHRNSHSGS